MRRFLSSVFRISQEDTAVFSAAERRNKCEMFPNLPGLYFILHDWVLSDPHLLHHPSEPRGGRTDAPLLLALRYNPVNTTEGVDVRRSHPGRDGLNWPRSTVTWRRGGYSPLVVSAQSKIWLLPGSSRCWLLDSRINRWPARTCLLQQLRFTGTENEVFGFSRGQRVQGSRWRYLLRVRSASLQPGWSGRNRNSSTSS